MTPELEAHLRSFVNFPSPPGVANHIIELAQDPDIEMAKVAKAVSMDPALTTKVLRVANSPLYAQRRRSESLRQALVVLGLNATLTLALSFSLVKTLRGVKPNGLNYPHYWRRALLAANASRALGEALGQPYAEERFLAGLLQDIGMLALDRGVTDLYRDLGATPTHREVIEHEKRRLGLDHAEVGAWLMKSWNLPERLCGAIEQSHRLEPTRAREPADLFNRCVALSGAVADIFLLEPEQRPINETAQAVERILGLSKEDLGGVLHSLSALIPDTEALYETDILGAREPELIMEQARDVLMIRNLREQHEARMPRRAAEHALADPQASEETRRDPLTGTFTREYFGAQLTREFAHATGHDWPLSLAFVDLDGLRQLNETHGTQIGDGVLVAAGRLLRGNTRETDAVARHGSDEFAVLLPATDQDTARTICERIIQAFERLGSGEGLPPVTVSIGYVTCWSGMRFESAESLARAAGQALYTAKLQGRNRAVAYEGSARQPAGQFL